MKCYSLVIEPRLVKEIDSLVKKYGLYSSRSDFIRDAIRQRLIELKQVLAENGMQSEEAEKNEMVLENAVEEAMEEFKYRGVH